MKVLFLPEYPDREFYTIIPIFMRLGWFATRDSEDDYTFGFHWLDKTWLELNTVLQSLSQRVPVVNLNCLDISKRRVEREFKAEFGRKTFVDPLSFNGRAVRKFDENARGGDVITLPIEKPEEGYVYQRLIDSARHGQMVEYRVPIVLGSIPLVYEEHKEIPRETIKTKKTSVEICEVDSVFDRDEIARILSFCNRMGLDFGELDVLRSREDGKIYVLDANKTPGGFGIFNKVHWTRDQRLQAIEILAGAFETRMKKWLSGDWGSGAPTPAG